MRSSIEPNVAVVSSGAAGAALGVRFRLTSAEGTIGDATEEGGSLASAAAAATFAAGSAGGVTGGSDGGGGGRSGASVGRITGEVFIAAGSGAATTCSGKDGWDGAAGAEGFGFAGERFGGAGNRGGSGNVGGSSNGLEPGKAIGRCGACCGGHVGVAVDDDAAADWGGSGTAGDTYGPEATRSGSGGMSISSPSTARESIRMQTSDEWALMQSRGGVLVGVLTQPCRFVGTLIVVHLVPATAHTRQKFPRDASERH